MILLPNEIIKDIPGYEGLYAATNFGRIWSYPKNCNSNVNGKFLKPVSDKGGYLTVSLRNHERRYKSIKVHRLVLYAFNGYSRQECNHVDGIKTNNQLVNLHYCSRSYNVQHAFNSGLNKITDLQKIQIGQARKNQAHAVILDNGLYFDSVEILIDVLSVTRQSIQYAIQHKGKCKGYGMEYASEPNQVGRI